MGIRCFSMLDGRARQAISPWAGIRQGRSWEFEGVCRQGRQRQEIRNDCLSRLRDLFAQKADVGDGKSRDLRTHDTDKIVPTYEDEDMMALAADRSQGRLESRFIDQVSNRMTRPQEIRNRSAARAPLLGRCGGSRQNTAGARSSITPGHWREKPTIDRIGGAQKA